MDNEIRTLRSLKDRVIERIEVRCGERALRKLWIGDANGMYYTLYAATRVLGLLPRGADAILEHLGTARHHLGACASELQSLGEDALATELRDAFAALETKVRASVDPYLPKPATPPVPPPRVVRVSATEYQLPCWVCGREAASFRIGRRTVDDEDKLVFVGIMMQRAADAAFGAEVFPLLEAENLARLHEVLNPPHFPSGLEVYCRPCDRVYCYEHSNVQDVYDGGYYDFSWGTCPHGHKREVND